MSALSVNPEIGWDSYDVQVVRSSSARDGDNLAVVRSITTAPSVRAQYARQQHNQGTHSAIMPTLLARAIVYVAAFALVISGGFAIGLQLQPHEYVGETRNYSVGVGQTLEGLAVLVQADRPLDDVMEDIRVLNSLPSDLLVPGQTVVLPVQ